MKEDLKVDLDRLAKQLEIEEKKAEKVQKEAENLVRAKPKSKSEKKSEIPHSIAVKFGKEKPKEPPKPEESKLEGRPKPKAEVVTKLPESPIEAASKPTLQKIATKITVDDPMFVPQSKEGSSVVTLAANLSERGTIRLPHRGVATIDCGFSMKLRSGYKAVLTLENLFAHKGLFISGSGVIDGTEEKRVQLVVINCGHQIVEIHHGDWLAQMHIEPVFLFEFIPTFLEA